MAGANGGNPKKKGGGDAKPKKAPSSASAPNLLALQRIRPVVSHPVASPRLTASRYPETSTGIFRSLVSTGELPIFAPRIVRVRTLCNGVHVFAELPDTATVGDIARELHTRLLLPPWRGILLSHWGRELAPATLRLVDAGLKTASILEAAIRLVEADKAAPLTRVRIASPHLATRHQLVAPYMLVRELKAEIETFLKKGVNVWHGPDGQVMRVEGSTLISKFTKPLLVKDLTSSMSRGEHFILVGLGGDKKDKWKVHRAASGHPAQLGFEDAVKLELPPKAQSLSYNGIALADDQPLSVYKVVNNDAIMLNFVNPAFAPVDGPKKAATKTKAPPKKK